MQHLQRSWRAKISIVHDAIGLYRVLRKGRHRDIPGRFSVNDTLVSAVFLAGVFYSVPYVTWSWPMLFFFATRSSLLVLSYNG